MQLLDNKHKVLDLLSQGATVLTPNNRLANELLEYYFISRKQATVEKPRCFPYRTALIDAYQQLHYHKPNASYPLLLSQAQCQHLWQTIIKTESKLIYTQGLLKAVMEAWEYCELWNINPESSCFHYTSQTQTFQKWWQRFNQKLNQLHAISEHQLVSWLQQENTTFFYQKLVWVCFDDFNPQQSSLQQHLNQHDVIQYRYDLPQNNISTYRYKAKDDNQEYQQVFAWLQAKLDEGLCKIGVVVPDLQQQSRSLERQLLRHFPPSLFDISLGQALSTFPMVDHALAWLKLDNNVLNNQEINLLLQSPWIAHAKDEFYSRSQYLQDSTLIQNHQVTLPAFIEGLQTCVPELAALLKSMKAYPDKASPSEWIDIFQERLNSLGFPGDYGLNSQSYQCLNRFLMLFDEFRPLQFVSATLKKNEALDAFIQLAEHTIFQPQKTNAPIQICGFLEASGCEYESLWVMGLTDKCLPQKIRLSAFIPPQIQRELAMPHSLPERELDFAQKTLQRLQRGSNHIIFSYAKLQGDTPNLPCPLIIDYPLYPELPESLAMTTQAALIHYTEDYQVILGRDEVIQGGTALLANQAKCPFKAFAQHRLIAKAPGTTSTGLDAREKGVLLHKVMELLWNTLKNQRTLLQENTLILNQYIDEAINTALLKTNQHHEASLPDLIQDIERSRLKRMIQLSLDWEKQRPSFSIVALEQSYSINLEGLDFAVRVDRIDQVGDSKWVIDYKSNLPSAKPWKEERPTEPQLLLYALLDKDINTLLLMQLKTGKVLSSGISECPQDTQGLNALDKGTSWEQQRQQWHDQLSILAQEIQNGNCLPKPVSATICEQCEFPSLCRY